MRAKGYCSAVHNENDKLLKKDINFGPKDDNNEEQDERFWTWNIRNVHTIYHESEKEKQTIHTLSNNNAYFLTISRNTLNIFLIFSHAMRQRTFPRYTCSTSLKQLTNQSKPSANLANLVGYRS